VLLSSSASWEGVVFSVEGLAHLFEGAELELADAFSGHAKIAANFFEREWSLSVEAEASFDDAVLALVEDGKEFVEVFEEISRRRSR